MKLLGLTGGIASGKSSVARMFSELGARLIDLDKLARRVTEPGARAYDEIVEHFGDTILDARGVINREKLGSLVFSDEKARKKLEEITHPKIGEELFKEIQKLREIGERCVLVEAPLLVEAGMHHWLKPFIVVTASRENQISRLRKRNGLTRKEALKRISSQMPLEEKAKLADYTIDNSGTLKETRHQVRAIWEKFQEKS